jgi:hypothetical protein
MSAQIIHYDVPFSRDGVRAEKKMLEFLKSLPSDCTVVRECKLIPSFYKKVGGSIQDQPDFIVVGPEIGVVVLEVKDWNIHKNRYEFIDQRKVQKISMDGNKEELGNPSDQADEYRYAVSELLKNPQVGNGLWVSSFVAFPCLIRAEFENRCEGIRKDNPQQGFIFDPYRTLFLDELNAYRDSPLELLQRYVEEDLKAHRRSIVTYTQQQVNAVLSRLVPAEFLVGGLPDYADAENKLATLDKEQREWAFKLTEKTYLSDVAGSGKTNVLLSRAIYWAKQHITTGGCRILVVTYSKPLREELKRIFQAKIRMDLDKSYYEQSIDIWDVISLMEEVVKAGMGSLSFEAWRTQQLSSSQENGYIEEALPAKCFDLIDARKNQYQIYDYLLIDEVQDFSTWFLYVTMSLLKNRENIFTVGDIGQKLFDRELEWGEFDIVRQRVEIQSRFLMYRSPQPVAKLAWKFLISDGFLLQDLKEDGYKTDIKPKSPFMSKPMLIPGANEEELLERVLADIQNLLCTAHPGQILCIGLKHNLPIKPLLRLVVMFWILSRRLLPKVLVMAEIS